MFRLRLRIRKKTVTAPIASPAMATPAPIPACAPVERELLDADGEALADEDALDI